MNEELCKKIKQINYELFVDEFCYSYDDNTISKFVQEFLRMSGFTVIKIMRIGQICGFLKNIDEVKSFLLFHENCDNSNIDLFGNSFFVRKNDEYYFLYETEFHDFFCEMICKYNMEYTVKFNNFIINKLFEGDLI